MVTSEIEKPEEEVMPIKSRPYVCLLLTICLVLVNLMAAGASTETNGGSVAQDPLFPSGSTADYGFKLRKNVSTLAPTDPYSRMLFTVPMSIVSDVPGIEFTATGAENWVISAQNGKLWFLHGGASHAAPSWVYNVFNISSSTIELGQEVIPLAHHGTNLGRNGLAFDHLWVGTYHTQGLLDFSNKDVVSIMKTKQPAPKPVGSFDDQKSEFSAAGLYAKELDPASLPLELTSYYQLKDAYKNNTDSVWVRNKLSSVKSDSWNDISVSAADVQRYINDYKKSHEDPDTQEPQNWGICLSQMVSWNYQGLYQLAKENEVLRQEIGELKADLDALKQALGK